MLGSYLNQTPTGWKDILPPNQNSDQAALSMKDTSIHQGGLLRCCIATITNFVERFADEPITEMVIDCQYEKTGNKSIHLNMSGVWDWNG